MILAHLPAGYILGRSLGFRQGWGLFAALVGAILPDFDMLWFHFIDNGAIHHHRYWVHVPGFWLACASLILPLMPGWFVPFAIFFASIMIHLILDSVGGGIMWLWPLSDHLFSLIEIPATQGHWVLSFILHWSFLSKIIIIAFALVFFRRAERP